MRLTRLPSTQGDAPARRVPAAVRPAAVIAVLAGGLIAAGEAEASRADWVAPVAGAVTRGFTLGPDPFAGGQHRGADFAAAPGTAARAACAGRVLVAGHVGSSGRVVTVRCGRWRVSHLPLDEVVVRAGASVGRGAAIGTVAAGRAHEGLHLGVRRDGRRFAYADPLRFIGAEGPGPPALRVPPASRRPPGQPPLRGRPASPRPLPPPFSSGSSPVRTGARPAAAGSGAGLAPWPVWLGLGLLLAGAVGAGVTRRPRRRRTPLSQAAAQQVR